MITYRYGPYDPNSEDGNWNLDRLMGLLSEMLLKYDIELDEALKMLLNRGLPVNIFLKEGGMEDLVATYLEKIQEQYDSILNKYTLKEAVKEVEADVRKFRESLLEELKKRPDIADQLQSASDEGSLDALFRIKWDLLRDAKIKSAGRLMDGLIKNQEEQNELIAGEKQFPFRGKDPLSRKEALKLLEQLKDLAGLREALEKALRDGDIFNFNLENLARHLGPESYQEFLERRDEIFKKLKELMEEKGLVVENQETGGMQLSPASVRRIGRRAVEEIFSNLEADDSGGAHDAGSVGESENSSSHTRPLEFGDSLSHMNIPGSVINALIRKGDPRPGLNDIEIYESRGMARASTIVLIDMSGSMLRGDRFYNAKKVALSMDSLIRSDFRDDQLQIVGFGTLAETYSPAQIPTLQPFPVTLFNPHIRLRIDMARQDLKSKDFLPLYFTNLQRGLQLSRTLLGSKETKNKEIVLITDGVPTSHFEDNVLHINYPPSPADFEAALREVKNCTDDGIVINTFLLTSDWEMNYFGEESFIQQFAKRSMGRIFYPHPNELGKMILVDFIANRKKQFTI